jgi:hypothetical protein
MQPNPGGFPFCLDTMFDFFGQLRAKWPVSSQVEHRPSASISFRFCADMGLSSEDLPCFCLNGAAAPLSLRWLDDPAWKPTEGVRKNEPPLEVPRPRPPLPRGMNPERFLLPGLLFPGVLLDVPALAVVFLDFTSSFNQISARSAARTTSSHAEISASRSLRYNSCWISARRLRQNLTTFS